jgi:hypothetical protein
VAELAAPALAAWTAYLLCRHLVGSFLPALSGGFFFGFSPYLINEFGQGHPNLSLVFLVPLAAYLVVRLLDGSLPRATGVAPIRSGRVVVFQLLTRPRPPRVPSKA